MTKTFYAFAIFHTPWIFVKLKRTPIWYWHAEISIFLISISRLPHFRTVLILSFLKTVDQGKCWGYLLISLFESIFLKSYEPDKGKDIAQKKLGLWNVAGNRWNGLTSKIVNYVIDDVENYVGNYIRNFFRYIENYVGSEVENCVGSVVVKYVVNYIVNYVGHKFRNYIVKYVENDEASEIVNYVVNYVLSCVEHYVRNVGVKYNLN